MRSILVTSAMPREGKTITASNLAIVMAQSGTRTLLMDADLRRPNVHRIFQQNRMPGLTDLLMSDNGLPEISPPHAEGQDPDPASQDFIRLTEVKNLHLLTCGARVPNPGLLLPSDRMREIMRVLGKQYDLIIVDSPPLGSVADAVTLGTEVGGTLMVIYSGKTKREIALQAKESLEGVNAQVIGAVLNNVDYNKQYGYYYYNYRYYSYCRYYHSDDEDE
jgi:Mrp family chromosome partitioning ATPase